ncbi:oxepin-CoA hydrolase, alternative type [Pararhodobacter zhoushanensis]|uniref:oxepin-CoA hydrolase, alternative type n=1 Tax=Pararhodobacter zhoushanensis TaxID=2479545 RepID=UPI000F8F7F1A|nr:enoyl-CoA hydratase family protein [Pararhodobacter zhoushanensis]
MTSTTEIRIETRGAVRILTMDGPSSRNSISRPQYEALTAAVIDAGKDRAVRAIVLTGAQGFFSSGGNVAALQESRQLPLSEVSRNTDALAAMILAIRACPTPLIAAVEGGAAGLGVAVALSCDMVTASAGAKFTVAYVKIGLTPDGGTTHFLREALPRQLASELCMLGRPVSAERLHAAGVVNVVADAGGALSAALELAEALAAGASAAIETIKSQLASAPQNALAQQVDIEGRGINAARYGREAGEGLAAFLEKRRPDFSKTGRD